MQPKAGKKLGSHPEVWHMHLNNILGGMASPLTCWEV